MDSVTAVMLILAGAALFALCAVHAGRVNSALDREIRTLRAEKRDLLDLVECYERCVGEGGCKAVVLAAADSYIVAKLFRHGSARTVAVRKFPFGDDKAFALLRADELCEKINED